MAENSLDKLKQVTAEVTSRLSMHGEKTLGDKLQTAVDEVLKRHGQEKPIKPSWIGGMWFVRLPAGSEGRPQVVREATLEEAAQVDEKSKPTAPQV